MGFIKSKSQLRRGYNKIKVVGKNDYTNVILELNNYFVSIPDGFPK